MPIARALWNGLPKYLRQFAHPPNPPLNFTPHRLHPSTTFNSPLTEDRTLQVILSRFYPWATRRLSSPVIATVAPRCRLLSFTFLDFDLAPKPKDKFGYCVIDLYSASDQGRPVRALGDA